MSININNLYVYAEEGEILSNINLKISKGESIGIVGESGSGKTILSKSILNISKLKINGDIYIDEKLNTEYGNDLFNKVAMVPQNPMNALDPVFKIKYQMEESLKHRKINSIEITEKIEKVLSEVGLNNTVLNLYPYELSGGMLQRIVIAIILLNEPDILIADEPTTALDVIVQLNILNLIKEITSKYNMTLLFISHDIKVVRYMCTNIIVMYCGEILEKGVTSKILDNPKHPYTKGLLNSIPNNKYDLNKIEPIKGNILPISKKNKGCLFYDRCPDRINKCKTYNKINVLPDREVKCILYGE